MAKNPAGDPGVAAPDMSSLITLLPYERQDQEQTQWCWAAVAASVAKYYDAETSWKQCTIVNAELPSRRLLHGGKWIRLQQAERAGRPAGSRHVPVPMEDRQEFHL